VKELAAATAERTNDEEYEDEFDSGEEEQLMVTEFLVVV
jgi:hypothetical protein